MANTFAPFGFHPIRRLDGSAWSGNQTTRLLSGTNTTPVFFGDMVAVLSSGFVTVATDTTATGNAGIFVGCAYLNSGVGYYRWNRFWPGSGATGDVTAFIVDDPNVVLAVQSTGATPLAFADIGQNVTFVASTGNTLSGNSTFALNCTGSTAATYPFRVVALPETGISINTDNSSANNVVYVAWNNQFYKQTSGI